MQLFLPDEEATMALAQRMADALPATGQPLIVYLLGDLGTGKTTFTRGLLRALGHRGAVRSPTYGLVTEYDLSAGLIRHLDLYRLQGVEELEALALRDLLAGSLLWLVEWPERGAGGLPPAEVVLALQVEGQGRRASLSSPSATGSQWLARVSGSAEA